MKRLIFSVFLILHGSLAIACPNCIGRLEQESPPFFSDELYQSAKSEDLNINLEELLQE